MIFATLLTKGLSTGAFTYRAAATYNTAGAQKTDINAYLAANKIKPTPISAAAATAYNEWVKANPKTVNVQVLNKYLGADYNNTGTVYNYMVQYNAGGLGVSCEYCHNLTNFSLYDPALPQKTTAKNMLVMQFELNLKWINAIPRPQGQPLYQIECATCHTGAAKQWNKALKAKNPGAFGVEGGGLPWNYTLIDDQFLKTRADPATKDINYFKVTATKTTPGGLADTVRNQNAMYHQSVALGVGCDFCHYAGYFPSYVNEKGDYMWPKAQARHMQGMLQDITVNWWPQMQFPDATTVESPNCFMCHRGISIPPGASDKAPQPVKAEGASLIKAIEELPIPKPVTK